MYVLKIHFTEGANSLIWEDKFINRGRVPGVPAPPRRLEVKVEALSRNHSRLD